MQEEFVMTFESESEVMQELEDEYSGEGEEEYEDETSLEGEGWLGAIGNVVGSLLGESEEEDEYEDESSFESAYEGEDEINPMRKIYPDAMMEHLGELASEAESEDEAAEHFLPLVGLAASKLLPVIAKTLKPMAKRAIPRIARAVMKSSPKLTKGIGSLAKTLHRNPQTRHLLKTVPTIARRAVSSIAKQTARGVRLSPHAATRTLARQARYVLGHPQHRRHALRRHNRLEQTFHRRFAPGMAYTHGHRQHRAYPRYYGQVPRGGVRGVGRSPNAMYGQTGRRVAPGVMYGQVAGRQCTCGTGDPNAAPAFCRCCGQALR
jgi:hypothetical protein